MSEPKKNSLKRKHWSIKQHESLIVRNNEGNFCLNIEGGAENGSFPVIGEIRQERICYRSGYLKQGELVLEVNHKRVAGMIKRDVIALIKRSADPLSLITVKQSKYLHDKSSTVVVILSLPTQSISIFAFYLCTCNMQRQF